MILLCCFELVSKNNLIKKTILLNMSHKSKDRRVAGAVPIYQQDSVVLVSNSKGNLIFPKGGIKKNETGEEACKREAKEEGGIEGEIMDRKAINKKGISFYFLMVTNLLDTYDESNIRERIIMKIDDVELSSKIPKYVKDIVKDLHKSI